MEPSYRAADPRTSISPEAALNLRSVGSAGYTGRSGYATSVAARMAAISANDRPRPEDLHQASNPTNPAFPRVKLVCRDPLRNLRLRRQSVPAQPIFCAHRPLSDRLHLDHG
jgi:hypothetical protein